MTFYQELCQRSAAGRHYVATAPIVERALAGRIELREYLAFLTQAFHHVRHTVPLLMAVGSRLPVRLEWLRTQVAEYVDEELGHEEWILNDIAAAGGDAKAARASEPGIATDAMVSYAWDTVMRRNPVGFFGMVYVLEGTSVAFALRAADQLQQSLRLPVRALTYLRSHGQLDQEHVHHLESILNRLDDANDRVAVLACANVMFRLYGNVFRALDEELPAQVRRSA